MSMPDDPFGPGMTCAMRLAQVEALLGVEPGELEGYVLVTRAPGDPEGEWRVISNHSRSRDARMLYLATALSYEAGKGVTGIPD